MCMVGVLFLLYDLYSYADVLQSFVLQRVINNDPEQSIRYHSLKTSSQLNGLFVNLFIIRPKILNQIIGDRYFLEVAEAPPVGFEHIKTPFSDFVEYDSVAQFGPNPYVGHYVSLFSFRTDDVIAQISYCQSFNEGIYSALDDDDDDKFIENAKSKSKSVDNKSLVVSSKKLKNLDEKLREVDAKVQKLYQLSMDENVPVETILESLDNVLGRLKPYLLPTLTTLKIYQPTEEHDFVRDRHILKSDEWSEASAETLIGGTILGFNDPIKTAENINNLEYNVLGFNCIGHYYNSVNKSLVQTQLTPKDFELLPE